MTHRRKLIEVALPLDAINRESAREKSIRHASEPLADNALVVAWSEVLRFAVGRAGEGAGQDALL